MDQRRCVNYFIVDGKKYYTGTVFKTKHYGDAAFVCAYDLRGTQYMNHVYVIYKLVSTGGERWTPAEMFQNEFVCITGAVDNEAKMPQTKHLKDSQIDGLALGWLWYIFLMAIATIFKANIGLWILISVVFFTWRHNKIQEEGTYIDWNGK